jgi:hypothetical protein
MSIQPQGENIRKAVKWISEEYQYGTGKSRKQLIIDACLKFNLTPNEEEFLVRIIQEQTK